MAQRRMLDKKISISEKIADLKTDQARLLYTWMIPHADDFGILPGSARTIKGLVVPLLEWDTEDIGNHLEDMVTVGLISPFQFNDKKYYRIGDFEKNQTLKKDRNPQTILPIKLKENAKQSWEAVDKAILESNGNQMEDTGFQMVPEVKRREEKRSIYNTGIRPEKNSVGEILQNKFLPQRENSHISTPYQEKAFRYAKELGIKLKDADKGRFIKVFKEEFESKRNVKGSTDIALSYLKDYQGNLTYEEKLNYFFSIYENGLKKYDSNYDSKRET